jgi:hypothetical protein
VLGLRTRKVVATSGLETGHGHFGSTVRCVLGTRRQADDGEVGMTAAEFLVWLERMDWSDATAAEQMRVDRYRIHRWRTGARPVPPYIQRLCELLEVAETRRRPRGG